MINHFVKPALLAGALLAFQSCVQASVLLCDKARPRTADEQDRTLQFAAAVRHELESIDAPVALISRSGLDLSRFQIRYSHAGLSLRANGQGAWAVRQLYFACDEGRPRLFDQGLSGFVSGTDSPQVGFVSIVWWPQTSASAVERTALDNARVIPLLAAQYSANAYAFSDLYQNCNQWVAEVLATAWGGPTDALAPSADARRHAQRALRNLQYAPAHVNVTHAMLAAAPFVPHVHLRDHPEDDRYALRLAMSLPSSLEAFVHQHEPQAQRVELCYDQRHLVIHRGWQPLLAAGCEAAEGDEVMALN